MHRMDQGSKGRRPSGAVLHSSREPVVRRPCSDLMDMLRRLINCRIIIIKRMPPKQVSFREPSLTHVNTGTSANREQVLLSLLLSCCVFHDGAKSAIKGGSRGVVNGPELQLSPLTSALNAPPSMQPGNTPAKLRSQRRQ